MGTIINFKCENCDFEFQDKDLIFYLDENDNLKEESLTLENSKLMTKSLLEGFLYESYCPNCNKLIKTYVPEMNNINLNKEEISEIISKYNKKSNEKDNEKDSTREYKRMHGLHYNHTKEFTEKKFKEWSKKASELRANYRDKKN